MLTGSKAIKEKKIFEYLSTVETNNISLDIMKKELGKILGIVPAIEVEWLPIKVLVEGKVEKFDQPVMINVFWSDSHEEDDVCLSKYYIG